MEVTKILCPSGDDILFSSYTDSKLLQANGCIIYLHAIFTA